nr:hypothetical protein BgiMline_020183 [Biomphalaria glabrata]
MYSISSTRSFRLTGCWTDSIFFEHVLSQTMKYSLVKTFLLEQDGGREKEVGGRLTPAFFQFCCNTSCPPAALPLFICCRLCLQVHLTTNHETHFHQPLTSTFVCNIIIRLYHSSVSFVIIMEVDC